MRFTKQGFYVLNSNDNTVPINDNILKHLRTFSMCFCKDGKTENDF